VVGGGPVLPPTGPPPQGPPPVVGGGPVPPPTVGGGPVKPTLYWIIAGLPGVGWRYTCVDPSLVVGYPLPPASPGAPDQGLPGPGTPPKPQPK
jgi:diaphanous 1/diaphanous 2